jgi:ATP-dependent Lon protease
MGDSVMTRLTSDQLDLFNLSQPGSKRAPQHSPVEQTQLSGLNGSSGSLLIYSGSIEKEWRTRALQRASDERQRKLIQKIPPGPLTRTLSPPPSASLLAELARRFPNFEAATACIRDYAMLCTSATGLRLRPMLLSGAPGLGKTAYARHLALLLGAPMLFVNIASATAGFAISGLDMRWSSGAPGSVFEALVLDDTQLPANRLMLVDEVDKAPLVSQHDPLGAFYSLLEPSTARRFCDEACDLPIDASAMIFIATANNVDTVPAPLLSRMDVFHIRPPRADEMPAVVESAWVDLRREEAWWAQRFIKDLDPSVIAALGELPSAREIVKRLRRAAGCAARNNRIQIKVEDVVASDCGSETGSRRIGFA